MVYFTGSKEKCNEAESLGKLLAFLLPDSLFENRGGKSIEECVSRCRLLGKSRIAVISCSQWKISKISFGEIDASSWKWLEPEVKIKSAILAKDPGEKPEIALLSGPAEETWRTLLGLEKRDLLEVVEENEAVSIECGNSSVKFISDSRKIVELLL